MSTASTPQLMTAEEFFDFANRMENRDRNFELEEGEIVEMPQPGERHGIVCANIVGLFYMYCRQRKLGRVGSNDMGVVLDRDPDTVRGPDVVYYTDSKKYADLNIKYPDTVPYLVVEVLSPTDRQTRMIRRLNRFLDSGATVVWLVDPESRSVTIWWQGQAPIVVEEGEEIANLPGLPEFRCKVAEIFDAPG